MVPMVVVILHKPFDLQLQLTRQIVVPEVDYVLDGPMVALDLSLLLRMVTGSMGMRHVTFLKICFQVTGEVARPIIR